MSGAGAPASAGLSGARDALLLPAAQYRLLLEIGTSLRGREPRGTLVEAGRMRDAAASEAER